MSKGPLTDVKAVQGNKGAHWVLQVRGNATVYTKDSVVTVSNQGDGFNPTTALFQVSATDGSGPKKGTSRAFMAERKVEPGRYQKVTLNLNEENAVTVDIIEVKTVH